MNERINELWRQAVLNNTKTPMNFQDAANEFAELIVKECAAQCQQEWYDVNNNAAMNAETDPRMVGIKIGNKQGAMKCRARIVKHFGVEE
jgi:hypothetical protein